MSGRRIFLALSALVWLVEGSMSFIGLWLFDIPDAPTAAYFSLAIVNLGILFASTPGYVGVFQAATVAVFGHSAEVAASFSVMTDVCQFLQVTLASLVVLSIFGFSMARLRTPGGSEFSRETLPDAKETQ